MAHTIEELHATISNARRSIAEASEILAVRLLKVRVGSIIRFTSKMGKWYEGKQAVVSACTPEHVVTHLVSPVEIKGATASTPLHAGYLVKVLKRNVVIELFSLNPDDYVGFFIDLELEANCSAFEYGQHFVVKVPAT